MKLSISAVIPVFNGEKFIRDAINSILSQTCSVQEIVVINDGSNDSSVAIAREMSNNSNIPIIIFSQSNSGVSAARNLGLIKSRGTHIAFLDVDDIWAPNKIEKQKELYHDDVDSELFTFTDYHVDERIDSKRRFYNVEGIKTCLSDKFSRVKFQSAFIDENFVGTASTIMFSRELALKINGFNIRLNHSEDFDFILRYSQYAEMRAIDEPLVLKRHHGDNLTGNLKLHFKSHLLAIHSNMIFNSLYCRFNYTEEILKKLAYSYDLYLIRYCNEVYEDSVRSGLKKYAQSLFKLQSTKGLLEYCMALLRKLVRTLSFSKVKRKSS